MRFASYLLAAVCAFVASRDSALAEPPGFKNSALPRIVQPVSSDACRSLISGVLPTASTKSVRISKATGP